MNISQRKSNKLDEILDAVSLNPRTDTDSIADAAEGFAGVKGWAGGRLGDFAYCGK